MDTLTRVQRRVGSLERFVPVDYSRASSVTAMLEKRGWETLRNRRAIARKTLM